MRGRWARALAFVAVLFVALLASTSLLSSGGVAYALTVAPTVPPSLLGAADGATSAVTTSVELVGADSAVSGVAGAAAVCTAATAGTCAVAAVAIAGVAYGTYKLIHWAFGPQHVQASQPTLTGDQVCNYVDNTSFDSANGDQYPSGTVCVNDSGVGSQSVSGIQATWTADASKPYSSYSVTLYIDVDCGTASTGSVTAFHGTAQPVSYSCASGQVVTTLQGQAQFGGAAIDTAYSQWSFTTGTASPGPAGATTNSGTLPQHTIKTAIQCMDSTDEVVSMTVYSTSPGFTDGDTSIPDTSATPCPSGTLPGAGTITETTPGSPDTTLYQVPAPPADPTNPCWSVGAGCQPTLQHLLNARWVDDTSDKPETGLSSYYFRCEWLGPSDTPDGGALPMSDCVSTIPNQTSTATSPTVPSLLGPAPSSTPDQQACWPHGWGLLNPVSWVLQPIECGLRWAFVPTDGAVETDVSALNSAWKAAPPGQAVDQAQSIVTEVAALGQRGTASGCAGPSLTVSVLHLTDWHPLDACAEPMATLANVVHTGLTILVYVGGAVVIARILSAAFGLQLPSFGGTNDEG